MNQSTRFVDASIRNGLSWLTESLNSNAIDIAREAAVDEVVIAGDMTSMLPLVHRLHAAGVRVVVVGPAHTPHDVRAACDDFIDVELLAVERPVVAGRHRA